MDIRERIVTECSQMLMSVGPTSMTMDDVARACGISKRTLYETFPDKRTLISECIRRQHEAKNAQMKEIFNTSSNCFEAMYRVYQRARKMYETTSVAFFNDIKRLYPDIFEKHIENEKTVIIYPPAAPAVMPASTQRLRPTCSRNPCASCTRILTEPNTGSRMKTCLTTCLPVS